MRRILRSKEEVGTLWSQPEFKRGKAKASETPPAPPKIDVKGGGRGEPRVGDSKEAETARFVDAQRNRNCEQVVKRRPGSKKPGN